MSYNKHYRGDKGDIYFLTTFSITYGLSNQEFIMCKWTQHHVHDSSIELHAIILSWLAWPFLMLPFYYVKRGRPFLIQLVACAIWTKCFHYVLGLPKTQPIWFILQHWQLVRNIGALNDLVKIICTLHPHHSIDHWKETITWVAPHQMQRYRQMWILILEQYNQEGNEMTKTYVCPNNIVG